MEKREFLLTLAVLTGRPRPSQDFVVDDGVSSRAALFAARRLHSMGVFHIDAGHQRLDDNPVVRAVIYFENREVACSGESMVEVLDDAWDFYRMRAV